MTTADLPQLSEKQLMEAVREGVFLAFDGAIRNATDMPTADILEEIRKGVRDAFSVSRSRPSPATDEPEPKPAGAWGPWRFLPENLTLTGCGCEIDLAEVDSSAAILDWLCQVSGKPWATPTVLASLVRAFDDILEPQANFCSFGREGPGGKGGAIAHRYAEQLLAAAP